MFRAVTYLVLGCAFFFLLTGLFGLLWAIMLHIAGLVLIGIVSITLAADAREMSRMNRMSQEEFDRQFGSDS